MFAIIGAIISGKMGFDLADGERGLERWLTRIFLISATAFLGAIGGYCMDFIICSFFRLLLA